MDGAIFISLPSVVIGGRPHLGTARARNRFVKTLDEVRLREGFSLIGYVVMRGGSNRIRGMNVVEERGARGSPCPQVVTLQGRVQSHFSNV